MTAPTHALIPTHPTYRIDRLGNVSSRRKRGFTDRFHEGENCWHPLKHDLVQSIGHVHVRPRVRLSPDRGMYFVDELVLLAFVGPRPEGCVIHYADGDKTHPALENVSWGLPTRRKAKATP